MKVNTPVASAHITPTNFELFMGLATLVRSEKLGDSDSSASRDGSEIELDGELDIA